MVLTLEQCKMLKYIVPDETKQAMKMCPYIVNQTQNMLPVLVISMESQRTRISILMNDSA